MKKISLVLALAMVLGMLSGCAGTAVVSYGNCTCPTGSHDGAIAETTVPAEPTSATEVPAVQGALKTGLYISTGISDSKSAAGEENGQAKYDVTMVAVLVDDEGVIRDCIIDGISTSVKFDGEGAVTTDLTAAPQTKNELGENYGMVAYGGAVAEWNEQAAALASYAVGKTVAELREGAIDESGYAPEGSDLATSATIYLGGYVSAIETAVENAGHLGAQAGDALKLAAVTGIDSSTSATEEKNGNAQLDVTVTALTMNGDTITSCVIDSVQAKVAFDQTGAITSDVSAPVATKNELGEQYGMKAWGGAIAEWDQQAASFAAYVTGKTPAEVAGIAVNERTAPADADLASSVTIAIGGFQALIAKAAQ